ncbi:MAG: PAS domain-containing protein [Candidatus Latescibacterota bacterium]
MDARRRADKDPRGDPADSAPQTPASQTVGQQACPGAAELEALLQVVPGIVLVAHDPECRTITGSRAAGQLLGLAPDVRLAGPLGWRVFSQGRELPPAEWPLERAARGAAVSGCPLEVILPDGTLHALVGAAAPVLDESGRPRGAVAAFADVTPQRVASAHVPAAGRCGEESLDPVFQATAAGALLYANGPARAMLRAAGWREGTPLPEPLWAGVRRALSSGRREEVEYGGGQGRVWSVVVTAGPGRDHAGLYAREVTERWRAEAALRAAVARLESTLASMAEGYFALDDHWRLVAANDVAERHFGSPIGLLKGQSVWTFTDMPTHALIRRRFEEARSTGQPVHFESESRIRPGYWAELHLYPRDGLLEVYFTNITERKRQEQALRDSEQHLRLLVEMVPSVLMRFDRQLRMVYVSPQAEAVTGGPVSRLLGKTGREAGLPEDLCALWEEAIEGVFRTAEVRDLEFTFTGPGGTRRFHARLAPERAADGSVSHVLGVATDITERGGG